MVLKFIDFEFSRLILDYLPSSEVRAVNVVPGVG